MKDCLDFSFLCILGTGCSITTCFKRFVMEWNESANLFLFFCLFAWINVSMIQPTATLFVSTPSSPFFVGQYSQDWPCDMDLVNMTPTKWLSCAVPSSGTQISSIAPSSHSAPVYHCCIRTLWGCRTVCTDWEFLSDQVFTRISHKSQRSNTYSPPVHVLDD